MCQIFIFRLSVAPSSYGFCSFFPRVRRSFSSVIHRCDVAFLDRIGFLVLAFFHKLPGWSIRSAIATASAAASFGREKSIVGWTTSCTPICTAATVASHWSAAASAEQQPQQQPRPNLQGLPGSNQLKCSSSFAAPHPESLLRIWLRIRPNCYTSKRPASTPPTRAASLPTDSSSPPNLVSQEAATDATPTSAL